MKEKSLAIKYAIIHLLIIIAMLVVGLIFLNDLPDQMAVHWGINNQPDNWAAKEYMIFGMPAVVLGMLLLFRLFGRIDPRRKNYKDFRSAWYMIQTVFAGFMAYVYFVSIYANFKLEINMGNFIVGGIGVLFVLLGNYLGKVRQNYFLGIRTPWALHNEDNWNKTQRMGGWAFAMGGLVIIFQAFIFENALIWPFVATVLVVILLPVIYSYIVFYRGK